MRPATPRWISRRSMTSAVTGRLRGASPICSIGTTKTRMPSINRRWAPSPASRRSFERSLTQPYSPLLEESNHDPSTIRYASEALRLGRNLDRSHGGEHPGRGLRHSLRRTCSAGGFIFAAPGRLRSDYLQLACQSSHSFLAAPLSPPLPLLPQSP